MEAVMSKLKNFIAVLGAAMLTSVSVCGADHHSMMDLEQPISSCKLRIYFSTILRDNSITQRELAETLFVNQSTISNFMTQNSNGEFICHQFEVYRRKNASNLLDLKSCANQVSLTTFDDIEKCLANALNTPLMPSSLKQAQTLKIYFDHLLKSDSRRTNKCDEILKLNGKLSEFLKAASPESNTTKVVYDHLLSYHRGVRLIREAHGEPFEPLSSVLVEELRTSWFEKFRCMFPAKHKNG